MITIVVRGGGDDSMKRDEWGVQRRTGPLEDYNSPTASLLHPCALLYFPRDPIPREHPHTHSRIHEGINSFQFVRSKTEHFVRTAGTSLVRSPFD